METRKQKKQWYVLVLLMFAIVIAMAQESGYLSHRIKPGDICYVDANGEEHFIDYRQWDSVNPPGDAQGVVCYSYYGTLPYGAEDEPAAWHGWIVSLDYAMNLAWAPENTICYDSCVALYEVDGIDTPYNPTHMAKHYGQFDTCGWQNTYRVLEFIYTKHHTTLSDQVSPLFRHIFEEHNHVSDFSEKPVMTGSSWYLPSYGQVRYMYGQIGVLNAALKACGGTLFVAGDRWSTSTEVGTWNQRGVWVHFSTDITQTFEGYLKKYGHHIRSFRNF